MQDARIKIGATLLLSFGAFAGVAGAVCAAVWWLVFARQRRAVLCSKMFIGLLALAVFIAAGSEFAGGGGGAEYFVRLAALLLIAGWAFEERRGGELLESSVWLLGRQRGFDIGLIGEMVLGTLSLMRIDAERIRDAIALKGKKTGIGTVVSMAGTLLGMQLRRSHEQAAVLAVRGYSQGGSFCPEFSLNLRDVVGFCAAILVAAVGITGFVMFLY